MQEAPGHGLDEVIVRHVAHLARLDLADDEVTRLAGELETIVGYVEQLVDVNVDGVVGVANIAGLEDITRSDDIADMLDPQSVLEHALHANAEAFLVPKAAERDDDQLQHRYQQR